MVGTREFWLRRLHSLVGVVALGLFLTEHLLANATALQGPAAYNDTVFFLQSIPFLHFVEFAFILAPICFHAVLGLYIAFISGYNAVRYSFFENIVFVLQRITGVFTFVFIVYHLAVTRFSGQVPTYQVVHTLMTSPFAFWFTLLGTVAATYHFANGLWAAAIHWGLVTGSRAQRVVWFIAMGLFLVFSSMGVASLVALA